MTNDTQQVEAPPPQEERPPKIRTTELTRASTDRMIAGVAEGLARRSGIWSGWIRAAFVLFTFAGGLGLVAYLALWALIRADNEPDSIAQRFFARTTSKGSWLGVALVFVGILILLDNVRFLSGGVIWAVGLLAVGYLLYTGDLPRLINEPAEQKEGVQQMTTTTPEKTSAGDAGTGFIETPPPPPPSPTPRLPLPEATPRETSILGRITFGVMALALGVLALFDTATDLVEPAARHYVALAVTILGIGLIVGAFMGRARWLIIVGVLALPFLFASPGLEYGLGAGNGGTVYATPAEFAELAPAYEHSIGELVIDLRDLPWDGESIDLEADLGIGQLTILLPDDVAVTGQGDVAIGEVDFGRQENSGLSAALALEAEGDRGSIDLDGHVGIGSLDIRRLPADN
jgi:phage shock protein PspC (stress-responsive transcriptional regulator)